MKGKKAMINISKKSPFMKVNTNVIGITDFASKYDFDSLVDPTDGYQAKMTGWYGVYILLRTSDGALFFYFHLFGDDFNDYEVCDSKILCTIAEWVRSGEIVKGDCDFMEVNL